MCVVTYGRLRLIFSCKQFREFAYTPDGQVKPLVFMSVDGGPDENPKNQQTMAAGIRYFTAYNLDALFIFALTPVPSMYNKVERRMAPLSKLTAEIVLPFESFDSHLDSNNETVD